MCKVALFFNEDIALFKAITAIDLVEAEDITFAHFSVICTLKYTDDHFPVIRSGYAQVLSVNHQLSILKSGLPNLLARGSQSGKRWLKGRVKRAKTSCFRQWMTRGPLKKAHSNIIKDYLTKHQNKYLLPSIQ